MVFRWCSLCNLSPSVCRDVAASVLVGAGALLFSHADHLAVALSSLDDPTWWWHLLVDGGFLLLYSGVAFVGLRGWRARRRGWR